jgi:hypothetical protein
MKTSSKTILGLGAGLAALATASYYFWGPDGRRNQRKMKGWMIKMKGEIIERIENAKELTEDVYNDIIDKVSTVYEGASGTGSAEVKAFAQKLKDQWEDIVESVKEEKEDAKKQLKKKK